MILVSDINLFSHGQFVYVIDEENNKTDEIGVFTIDSLGKTMADYCYSHKITKIKLFGNPEYLQHTVVPDINKQVFYNYDNFKIDIEVIDK